MMLRLSYVYVLGRGNSEVVLIAKVSVAVRRSW